MRANSMPGVIRKSRQQNISKSTSFGLAEIKTPGDKDELEDKYDEVSIKQVSVNQSSSRNVDQDITLTLGIKSHEEILSKRSIDFVSNNADKQKEDPSSSRNKESSLPKIIL